MRVIDPEKFLQDLSGRYAKPYAAAVSDMLVALATRKRDKYDAAFRRFVKVDRETRGVAALLGASITLRQAARLVKPSSDTFAALTTYANQPSQTVVPSVTFREALDDFVTRAPVTIQPAAARTAEAIAELYSTEHVAAFAKSAEDSVTREVQRLIGKIIEEGATEATAGRLITDSVEAIREETGAWAESYARMAFRTNVNTAVTEGRMQQARDPDIAAVIPAFRFDAVGDADTRHNHDAMDGVIMRTDNPHWHRLKPPLGYNCRCTLSLVSVPQLKRMGKYENGILLEDEPPRTAFPDPGFRP